MSTGVEQLWAVARDQPAVDADALAAAVEAAGGDDPLDFRTRLLVRDSLRALESHWGPVRFNDWIAEGRRRLRDIGDSVADCDDHAFPSLQRRIVDATKPDTVMRLLRDVSAEVTTPTRMLIGGSIALILRGYLARHTEDLDVVDEVPAELRVRHDLLNDLERRYGLRLAHFQSHYLPSGWEQRIGSVGAFDKLQVFAVDPYDVVVGKLFSSRTKDRDDLQAVASQLDRETLIRRVRETTVSFRSDEKLREAAEKNWFVLFGEPLPG